MKKRKQANRWGAAKKMRALTDFFATEREEENFQEEEEKKIQEEPAQKLHQTAPKLNQAAPILNQAAHPKLPRSAAGTHGVRKKPLFSYDITDLPPHLLLKCDDDTTTKNDKKKTDVEGGENGGENGGEKDGQKGGEKDGEKDAEKNGEKGGEKGRVEDVIDGIYIVGIIAFLANSLAKENISIFNISTYETNYILVKEEDFQKAKKNLSNLCEFKE